MVQEPTVTSTIVAKKTTTWGESGFPSEFLGFFQSPRYRLAADLFDQVFQRNIYQRANIDPRKQTFEKLQGLEGHLHSVLMDADALVSVPPNLVQLNSFLQSRIADLFQVVSDYAENVDGDPIHKRDAAAA